MSLTSLLGQIRQISSKNNIAAFKTCIDNAYQWLDTEFELAHDVTTLVTGRSAFVDALLRHAWKLHELERHTGLAMVAVGGYGRGHLQPYSDIDLLFLIPKSGKKELEDTLSTFITFLWDIGLDIGQSVRTVKETVKLAKDDITIATNLIESRLLAGDVASFDALGASIQGRGFWSSKDFFLAKAQEQKSRHAKFHGTAYNLEPNVKENPGCLRDIQTIGWVAKKHFKVLKGRELVEQGYFTEQELDELIDCRQKLWRIRFALHLHTGRNENRLLFDYQPALAERLGYGDDGKAAVERMMKAFFRTVRRVNELNQMLLLHFRQDILQEKVKRKTPLNDDFEVWDGLLYPTHARVFDSPDKLLKAFLLIADNQDIIGIHAATLRLLRDTRRHFSGQYFCQYAKCRAVFMDLVKHPNFFGLAWDLMYQHGVMQAYLPQWDHIVGMMQFDLFHAYTVDEHTHRLIKNVYHYTLPASKEDFPRCHRIVQNLEKPHLLFLAGIFHDIAKGRNGDHSKLGAEDVLAFADTHEMSAEDTELVRWLVDKHLLMSVIAQRRDIYDPEVVKEFATTVRNKNNLNHLYALTLADIRATNNNLWNDWKSTLLRELYKMTRKALEEGLESQADLAERIGLRKDEAANQLLRQGFASANLQALWKRFDTNYFVRFSTAQLVWHAGAILSTQNDSNCLVVELNNETARRGTEVLIYTKDRANLFAQVASVLDSRHCSIQDANLMSTDDGYVLDTFILLEQNGDRITSQSRLDSLRDAIVAQLESPGSKHSNQRKMPRRMKQLQVPTKMRFFTTGNQLTLLELEALDAPGLLARISEQFAAMDINLHMAKISTIGERAEDIFILSNQDGHGLTQEQQVALKQLLTNTLDNYQGSLA